MRRIISAILAFILSLGVIGCSANSKTESIKNTEKRTINTLTAPITESQEDSTANVQEDSQGTLQADQQKDLQEDSQGTLQADQQKDLQKDSQEDLQTNQQEDLQEDSQGTLQVNQQEDLQEDSQEDSQGTLQVNQQDATEPQDKSITPISVTQQEVEPTEQKIYKTKTGGKYHRSDCYHLKSRIEVTLDEALRAGLKPCRDCRP